MAKVFSKLAGDEPFEPQAMTICQGIVAAIIEVASHRENLSCLRRTACLDESVRQVMAYIQGEPEIEIPVQSASQDGDGLRTISPGSVYIRSIEKDLSETVALVESQEDLCGPIQQSQGRIELPGIAAERRLYQIDRSRQIWVDPSVPLDDASVGESFSRFSESTSNP